MKKAFADRIIFFSSYIAWIKFLQVAMIHTFMVICKSMLGISKSKIARKISEASSWFRIHSYESWLVESFYSRLGVGDCSFHWFFSFFHFKRQVNNQIKWLVAFHYMINILFRKIVLAKKMPRLSYVSIVSFLVIYCANETHA